LPLVVLRPGSVIFLAKFGYLNIALRQAPFREGFAGLLCLHLPVAFAALRQAPFAALRSTPRSVKDSLDCFVYTYRLPSLRCGKRRSDKGFQSR